MVYIFGLFGLVMGFGVGLGVINVLLRHYSVKQIKENPSMRWKYGVLVWIFAGLGSWSGIWIYNNYFL